MNELEQALRWDGVDAMVSLFAVHPRTAPAVAGPLVPDPAPVAVGVHVLHDADAVLPGLVVVECDLTYERLPADLAALLTGILEQACADGAVLAWLGFEGSFHFEHLLTADIADQIYGVCSNDLGPRLAPTRAVRRDEHWRTTISTYREILRGSGRAR
ncbi:hypothetical protein [Embleya sp. NPDC059259]|uniref:hypothetical protein n=1 Tax=unclassified Embleya TaxID=2699296 RepID=UPI0036888FCD